MILYYIVGEYKSFLSILFPVDLQMQNTKYRVTNLQNRRKMYEVISHPIKKGLAQILLYCVGQTLKGQTLNQSREIHTPFLVDSLNE